MNTVHYNDVMPKFTWVLVFFAFSFTIYLDKIVSHFNTGHLSVICHNMKIIIAFRTSQNCDISVSLVQTGTSYRIPHYFSLNIPMKCLQ